MSSRDVYKRQGSHQAIDLATRILGEAGETAWVEDPGYWGARTVLQEMCIRDRPQRRVGWVPRSGPSGYS